MHSTDSSKCQLSGSGSQGSKIRWPLPFWRQHRRLWQLRCHLLLQPPASWNTLQVPRQAGFSATQGHSCCDRHLAHRPVASHMPAEHHKGEMQQGQLCLSQKTATPA